MVQLSALRHCTLVCLSQGTDFVFSTFLLPLLNKNEDELDKSIANLQEQWQQLLGYAVRVGSAYVQSAMAEILSQVAARSAERADAASRQEYIQQQRRYNLLSPVSN